jgi:hypothetical protein
MGTEPLAPGEADTAKVDSASAHGGVAEQRGTLNLYLADSRQLFNSMDPAPFRQRDLDPNASAYIVEWAEEVPADQSLSLVLHLGDSTMTEAEAAIIRQSVGEYFRLRALAKRRQLQEMFRVGRYSLLIALVFLATVTVLVESLASVVSEQRYVSLIENGLAIGSWVALWRPLEIFLYDWWPIGAKAKLFDRLSAMPVRTVSVPATASAGAHGYSA